MTRHYLAFILILLTHFQGCSQKNKNVDSNNKDDSLMTKKTDDEWKKNLTPNQYYILREKGTEQAGTGEFLFNKENGVYKCAGCGNELFTDNMKFESHCGWPSFDREIDGGKIKQIEDFSHGMHRIEIQCAKCGGHLGHIFDDGPTNTGKRYCVNGGALSFEPRGKIEKSIDTITFGGGCFWCMEAIFQDLKGVKSVASGYAGGNKSNATYPEVCSGETGHAEVIQIAYDPAQIPINNLLQVFFNLHDPTTMNKQGADEGTQYRSIILYRNEAQKSALNKVLNAIEQAKIYDQPVVTEVRPFTQFYKAEDYHQNYYKQNKTQPYCRAVIQPKMEKLEKLFGELKQRQ